MKHINKFTTEEFEAAKESLQSLKHYLVYNTDTKVILTKAPLPKTMKFVYGEEEINLIESFGGKGGWPVITRKDLFKSIKYNGKELIPEKTVDPVNWENLFSELGMEVTNYYKAYFFLSMLALVGEDYEWNPDYVLTDEDILGRPLQANDEIILEVEFKDNIEDLSALTSGYGIGLKEISSNLFENCTNVTNFAYAFDISMVNMVSHVYDSKLESSCPVDKDGTPLYLRSTEKKDGYAIVKQPERCFGGCSKMSDFDEIPAPWGGNNFDDCKIIIETSGFDSEFPGYFKERLENGEFTKYILSSGANGFNAPYGFSVGMDRISKRPVVISSITFKDYSTSQITDMSKMFYYCNGLTNLDLSNFDTSNVTDMSGMFYGCIALNSLDLSKFNTTNVANMSGMFAICRSLTNLDLSNFDTSNVTDMSSMFSGLTVSTLDVHILNTSKVQNMSKMFASCKSLTELDISNFDTTNVTDMSGMFNNCTSLTSLDLSNFNTSQVTNMNNMFYLCSGLTSLDVSSFDTSNVTDMGRMFDDCKSLTELDISKFNTNNVTDMSGMFNNCRSLTSLDLSNFNTSQVTNMDYMFYLCSGLTSLDLSKFDTSNVTDMSYMFRECSSLTSLDLSKFDTSNVSSISYMFTECSGLTSLDLSNFDTSKVNYKTYMFSNCTSLSKIKCKQAFKDWCITNKNTISLPDTMVNGTVGAVGSGSNWEIVDYTPQP